MKVARQTTLRDHTDLCGVGVHSGLPVTLTLHPDDPPRPLFGLPIVDTEQLISWTADWVSRSMPSLGKPTKYEVRDGRY